MNIIKKSKASSVFKKTEGKRAGSKQSFEGQGKKGEITTDSTLNMVLLIIGFVVIIVLIGMIAYYTIIKERSCHDSIVMRSSINNAVFSAARMVPLKCETEKICLTSSGETCPVLGVASKDNVILKKKISTDPDKAKNEVLDQMATALYQCHSMLGEGLLNFMPPGMTDKNYCLICSRIVLDDKARQEVQDISYSELYQYLSKKRTSDGKSYLEYLHPGWTDWRSSELLFRDMQASSSNVDFKNLKFEDWKIDLENEKGQAIIAQIAPAGYWKVIAGTGVVVLGAIATATYVGAPVGIALIGAGASGVATFWYGSPGGKFEYSPPEVYPYNLTSLQNMGCYSFETAP